jgi:autotransporter strand-loop-strand O-heptosyltransferase
MTQRYGNITVSIRDTDNNTGDLAIANEQFTRDIYGIRRLGQVIKPTILLDIGGHIGCCGLLMLDEWPEAKLIAFEPNRQSCSLYRENVRNAGNDEKRVTVHNAAVGSVEKTVLAENPAWVGGGIMLGPSEPTPPQYVVTNRTVTVVSIKQVEDDIHAMHDIPSRSILLKLDCEGAEQAILDEMSDRMAEKIAFICGEYHNGWDTCKQAVLSRFPDWDIVPISPMTTIGNFLAGPENVTGKLKVPMRYGSSRTPLGNYISVTYAGSPKITISGPTPATYHVRFDDTSELINVYGTEIQTGQWATANPEYYIPWRISVAENGSLCYQEDLDLAGKKVLIVLSSKSLGDSIAWAPYTVEFMRTHQCEVHVSSFWSQILKPVYPDVHWYNPNCDSSWADAVYTIGCFDDNYNKNKANWRKIPVQKLAADTLGLPFVERPSIVVASGEPRPIQDEYVAISEFSTFHGKKWLYPHGWQIVVDYLNSIGLKVMSISSEPTGLRNVIKANGRSIQETIRNIQHAKFYIGVSSGPMWLAYGLGVPRIVISGFTEPYSEMTDCYRVINQQVCNGCYNDLRYPFDRGNWLYCPRNKNFECSTAITPEMVINAIDRAISDNAAKKQLQRSPIVEWQPKKIEVAGQPNAVTEKRVLHIMPHCSTGGLPQYTLGCVTALIASGYSVQVVEWNSISDEYTVQKEAIKRLCPLHTLQANKESELERLVNSFRPDVVHIQELGFMSDAAIAFMRRKGCRIVQTTHDSAADPKACAVLPDRFGFVCHYHQEKFAGLGIPSVVVEYAPTYKRASALGRRWSSPHPMILHVGLFTPNKNQGELFEIARRIPLAMFYCVGNQAHNFRHYWEPLMSNKPENVVICGEQSDVDSYYRDMDVMVFPSKAELAPIVPVEALAVGMPVFMRKLPIYMGRFDEHLVTYITEDVGKTVETLRNFLFPMAKSLMELYD